MTYTIVGRCERTGQLGVGIATYSLAVGGYCPMVRSGLAALVCQAYGDPRLRRPAMRSLEEGDDPGETIEVLRGFDPFFEYRQVGIVAGDGRVSAWTGPRARGYAGHKVGDGYVALGNALADAGVVDAIADGFAAAPDRDLDERLLLALEAGRDAGGQRLAGGAHMTERSAALIVHGDDDYPLMDLRVDVHATAVDALRTVRDTYHPYIEYYDLRVKDPPNTPAPDAWEAALGTRR